MLGKKRRPLALIHCSGGWLFHHAHVFRQLWNKSHKRLQCCILYVKWLLSKHYAIQFYILCTYSMLTIPMLVNNKTSFESIHGVNHSFFPVMSTLEIMLANLHSQSAIYRGFRSLDTAVLFVIECLSLLQTRIWGHSMFAFSFSWGLLNRLSDMPD